MYVRALGLQPPGEVPAQEPLSRFMRRMNEEEGYGEIVDQQTGKARKAPPPEGSDSEAEE